MKIKLAFRLFLNGKFFRYYLFLLFFWISFSTPLQAATWYISQSGAGSMNGTTPENAWKFAMLDEAWSNIQPGDTLYIIGRINTNQFLIGASGGKDTYVIIAGYNSEAMIDLTSNRASTLSWEGPDDYGAYRRTDAGLGGIVGFAEWNNSEGPLNWIEITKQTKVPDSDWKPGSAFFDAVNQTLYWKPRSVISGKTLSVGSNAGIYLNGKNWVKITDLKIYGGRIGMYNSYGGRSEHIWLNNLYMDALNGGYPLGVIALGDCNYVRVSYCTIKRGLEGIWNSCTDGGECDSYVTIDHNTITDMKGANDSHCIGLYGGGEYWLIEHNDLSYCNTGITMYGARVNHNIIRYNYIHHMEGSRAAKLNTSRGYGIGFEGNISAGDTRIGNHIYGNIVHNCTGVPGGMEAFGINTKFYDSSNYIYNNTVYNCSPNYLISNMQIQSVTQPTGGLFKNNISYEPNDSAGLVFKRHVFLRGNSAGYSELNIDYNLYYPDGAEKFQYGSLEVNFANWKTELNKSGITGHDNKSIVSPPLFSNTSGELLSAVDFKPLRGSPAVNKGDNSIWSGKPDIFDFTGSIRITDPSGTITAPGGVVDIGAYELPRPEVNSPINLRVVDP